MPETIKVLKTATTPEGIGVQQQVVKPIVATVGIRADDLSSKDLAKVTELMQKSKKPVEFALSFNGDAISYLVRVAGTKIVLDQMLLSAERDAAKRSKILDKLVSLGAATQAQADAFNKAHPDQDKLDDLKKQIDELRKKIADEQKQLDELTKQYKGAGGK